MTKGTLNVATGRGFYNVPAGSWFLTRIDAVEEAYKIRNRLLAELSQRLHKLQEQHFSYTGE